MVQTSKRQTMTNMAFRKGLDLLQHGESSRSMFTVRDRDMDLHADGIVADPPPCRFADGAYRSALLVRHHLDVLETDACSDAGTQRLGDRFLRCESAGCELRQARLFLAREIKLCRGQYSPEKTIRHRLIQYAGNA